MQIYKIINYVAINEPSAHSNANIEKAEKMILHVLCIQVYTYTSGKQCQSLHILIVHNIIKPIFFKFVFICRSQHVLQNKENLKKMFSIIKASYLNSACNSRKTNSEQAAKMVKTTQECIYKQRTITETGFLALIIFDNYLCYSS